LEPDGKNGKFERPVLVLKYINKDMVLIAPLTTKGLSDKNHVKIDINGTVSLVKISQIRVVSSKRLLRKISTLSDKQFLDVRKRVVKFIS
jgi:mRNA-degrading endonuclease toxin of MazEF toxin-antitoxin module